MQAEQEKKTLLQLKAECNAVETSGQATAEARARAEAAQIEGEARVKQAELKVKHLSLPGCRLSIEGLGCCYED